MAVCTSKTPLRTKKHGFFTTLQTLKYINTLKYKLFKIKGFQGFHGRQKYFEACILYFATLNGLKVNTRGASSVLEQKTRMYFKVCKALKVNTDGASSVFYLVF